MQKNLENPMSSTEGRSRNLEEKSAMASLREKLKSTDLEIQQFVLALEKENIRLIKKIAKLQAENITLNSRIMTLEEQAKIPQANVSISF